MKIKAYAAMPRASALFLAPYRTLGESISLGCYSMGARYLAEDLQAEAEAWRRAIRLYAAVLPKNRPVVAGQQRQADPHSHYREALRIPMAGAHISANSGWHSV